MKSIFLLSLLLILSFPGYAEPQSPSNEEEILRLKIKELELRKEILELEAKKGQTRQQEVPTTSLDNHEPPATSITPSTYKPSNSNYIRGPRGGCYTYSSSGRKRYVDRSLCN